MSTSDKLGWDAPRGAKVRSASAGSPADKAGVKAGDIIVAVDRAQIDTASELNAPSTLAAASAHQSR